MTTALESQCAELAMRFKNAAQGEVGDLYLKILKWAKLNNGQLPEEALVVTFCKRMTIDTHRSETGQRNGRPGYIKVSIEDTLTVDGRERLCGTPPELVTQATQGTSDFKRLVARLDPTDRRVMNLKADGYTFSEIGDMLEVSPQRIEQRLRASTLKLQELARK
jgi:RNA polymerase sigma factor (sigma-70 family)